MKTRLDPSLRLELVTNRIIYLGSEIKLMNEEIESLTREQEILTNLKSLYDKLPDDRIDAERSIIFGDSPKDEGTYKSRLLAALSEGETYNIKDIVKLTDIHTDKARIAVAGLMRTGEVESAGWGLYRKAEK